jgi:mevalonate kinase
MKSQSSIASAPAKVILFGEHFVVYGTPAILAAINRRTIAQASFMKKDGVEIESDIGAAEYPFDSKVVHSGKKENKILAPIHHAVKKIQDARGLTPGIRLKLRSEIPPGIGLGSSAASCVASIAAVDSLFGSHGKNWICKNAIESEKMIHKNSSGADCYVSTFGGVIRYSKRLGYRNVGTRNNVNLIVGNTGILHSTGRLVESVRKFRQRNLGKFKDLSMQADEICTAAMRVLKSGDVVKLGTLMTENQDLLRDIRVSHKKAEALIELSLKAGALGAKITGAGGGGAIIALAKSRDDGRIIADRIRGAGYESMEVKIDHVGLLTS